MKTAKQKSEAVVMQPLKFSISNQMYVELQALLPVTNYKNFSELLRAIIEGKKTVGHCYDSHPDKLIQELADYRQAIESMQASLDEVVYRIQFQTKQPPEVIKADMATVIRIQKDIAQLAPALMECMTKIAARWLPELSFDKAPIVDKSPPAAP